MFYRPGNPGVSKRSRPKGRGNENVWRLALLEEDVKNRKYLMDRMLQTEERKLEFVERLTQSANDKKE